MTKVYHTEREAIIGALDEMLEFVKTADDEAIEKIRNNHVLVVSMDNSDERIECKFLVNREEK